MQAKPREDFGKTYGGSFDLRNLDIAVNNPSQAGVVNEQDSIHSARNELSKTVMDFKTRKSDMKHRH
jgi:hypothetical protein